MMLERRGIVITGGGRGIGAAVARAVAAAGGSVVLAARTEAEVRETAAVLTAGGHAAWPVVCDVTQPDDVARLATRAADLLGSVDVLVNNAGVAHSAPLAKIDLEDWNRLFAVNATGTFLCTQALLPGMIARGWGRVVNIASVAGLSGARYIAAYAAAKHAVIGFTRSVAAEVAAGGVTVNAVCPGYVDTAMTTASVNRIASATGRTTAAAREAILQTTPQHRLIAPDEVAHAVLALCDHGARGINGQCIVLDGGGLLA
ncbi:MAG TPA: SDR family NAD(P)-dependent oxidoreductase [Gemmatimonadales bacterium]